MTQPHARDDRPVVFISYAWSSEPHKLWVQQLADDLVANNVEVIFDGYELKPGHDTFAYMEQMVTNDQVRKVLCVSDRLYQEKADGREGGVGTETQIITPELYAKTTQTKFVPLVRELDGDGKPYLPAFLKGKFFIDFSDDDQYDARFDELLRDIYGKPKRPKPPFGPPPAFLSEDAITLATAGMARRIERALREDSPTARGLIEKYADAFMGAMPKHRLSPEEARKEDMDDRIWESIHQLVAYRDDYLQVVDAVALYGRDERLVGSIHKFLERSLEWTEPPTGAPYNEIWFDNHRFLRRDIFACTVALLLRRDCPSDAARLLSEDYYTTARGRDEMVTFGAFDEGARSLDELRNRRLKLNRMSVTADLIRELTPTSYFPFEFYCQVDFLLFVRAVMNRAAEGHPESWNPRTKPYFEQARFELFQRARTPNGLATLLTVLGAASKAEFLKKFEAGGAMLSWERGYVLRLAESWPDAT